MKKQVISALFIAVAFTATSASALGDEIDREAAAAEMKERFEATATRLNLTEEQKPEVEAILRDAAEQRKVVMESYGIKEGNKPKLKPRQLRSMRGELNEISEKTTAKLSGVLDSTQMAEYEKIKEEQQAELRERIQSN